MTVSYLVAQLAFEVDDYSVSLRMLSNILGNKNVSVRIKEKAIDLKNQIREKVNKK